MLSRILYYVPYHAPMHPGRVFVTFGFISSAIEALNANGAVLVSNSSLPQHKQDTGKALLKAALLVQLAVLCAFVYLAAHFHKKCKKAGVLPKNLVAVLHTLYISSFLIGARTIFRTVEYFIVADLNFYKLKNPNEVSVLLRYEWYFWVFESSFMVVNTLLLNVRHPMRFLPRNINVYLAQDGITEVEGPGYVDKRPLLVTVLDPFDLKSMFTMKSSKEERFWETHAEGRGDTLPAATSGGNGEGKKNTEAV